MLRTNLVNFSLVVWAVTAYFSCTMWDGIVHWIFHCFISAQEKHFINDTIRSEFHRKFMDKYVRWRKALSTDLPPSIMHYTQNCNILLCSFIFGKKLPTHDHDHLHVGDVTWSCLHSPATPPYMLVRCCGIIPRSRCAPPLMPYVAMHTVRSLCLFLVPEDETGMCVGDKSK